MYITLYFTKFDLEYSRNCENDYLLITEGSGYNLRYVGKYCGSDKPTNFRTSSNVLTLRFVTNSRIERNGFRATYYFQYKLTARPKTATTTINPIIIDPLRGRASATKLVCILMEFVLDVHTVVLILMDSVFDLHTGVCILMGSVLDVHTVVCILMESVLDVNTVVCILMAFALDVHVVECILMEIILDVHTLVCILIGFVFDVHNVVCILMEFFLDVHTVVCILI